MPPAIPFAVEELEAKAKALLSPEAYDWVASVAGGGRTARANLAAFDQWQIVPRMLCDISQRDFSVEILGHRWPGPLPSRPSACRQAVIPRVRRPWRGPLRHWA